MVFSPGISDPIPSRRRLSLRRQQSPPPPYSSEPAPEYQADTANAATTPRNSSRRTNSQLQDPFDARNATPLHLDDRSVPIPPGSARTHSPVLPEGEVVLTVGSVKIRGTPTAVSQAAANLCRVGSTPCRVSERAAVVEDEVFKGTVRKIVGHGSWYLIWHVGIWLGVWIWLLALVIMSGEIEFWSQRLSYLDREVWFRLFSYALGCGLLLGDISVW